MSYIFDFTDFSVEDTVIKLRYAYREHDTVIKSFEEKYVLPVAINPSDATILYVLKVLHLIVGISYYKSLRGEVITPYELNSTEVGYLNDIYDFGLGEFAYINEITEPIRPFSANSSKQPESSKIKNSGAILGVGGGKDSVVAGEILKGIGIETTTMDVATRDNHGQAGKVMDIMGLPQMRIERYLDTSLTAFIKEYNGANGHVPLSVILAWLGILLAVATGKKYISMANEAGTSTGNTVWNGREVNHQWAKSLQQEQLTQDFVHASISPDLHYFSPIRPYSSLAVMELLATLGTSYLNDFTSCNLVLRIDPADRPTGRWCTECAKCLSSWLLLATWLATDQLIKIFGRNLWDDVSLRPTLDALLGLTGHKPLDCVGTIDELRAATRKIMNSTVDLPLLANLKIDQIPGPDIAELVQARSPATIPVELADKIEHFVIAHL